MFLSLFEEQIDKLNIDSIHKEAIKKLNRVCLEAEGDNSETQAKINEAKQLMEKGKDIFPYNIFNGTNTQINILTQNPNRTDALKGLNNFINVMKNKLNEKDNKKQDDAKVSGKTHENTSGNGVYNTGIGPQSSNSQMAAGLANAEKSYKEIQNKIDNANQLTKSCLSNKKISDNEAATVVNLIADVNKSPSNKDLISKLDEKVNYLSELSKSNKDDATETKSEQNVKVAENTDDNKTESTPVKSDGKSVASNTTSSEQSDAAKSAEEKKDDDVKLVDLNTLKKKNATVSYPSLPADSVKKVQEYLNSKFNANLAVDGKIGPNTTKAIQTASKITVDGIFGKQTKTAFDKLLASTNTSGTQVAKSNQSANTDDTGVKAMNILTYEIQKAEKCDFKKAQHFANSVNNFIIKKIKMGESADKAKQDAISGFGLMKLSDEGKNSIGQVSEIRFAQNNGNKSNEVNVASAETAKQQKSKLELLQAQRANGNPEYKNKTDLELKKMALQMSDKEVNQLANSKPGKETKKVVSGSWSVASSSQEQKKEYNDLVKKYFDKYRNSNMKEQSALNRAGMEARADMIEKYGSNV